MVVAALVTEGWAEAKGIAESVLAALGMERSVAWERGGAPTLLGDRAATLRDGAGVVGVVGEVSPAALRAHGLEGPVAVLELRADRLCDAAQLELPYSPVSRFPAVERDVAWVVRDDVAWSRIADVARSAAGPLARDVRFVSEFRGPQVGAGLRSVAFRVERLHAAGFRMASLTHFFDNDLAGSMHGLAKGGLTDKGREAVRRMEALGMIVDVAHCSRACVAEILAMARRPVVSSHGGVQATCKVNRNLTDDEIRGVARTGGVVGIGFWEGAVCSTDPRAVARAMRIVASASLVASGVWAKCAAS